MSRSTAMRTAFIAAVSNFNHGTASVPEREVYDKVLTSLTKGMGQGKNIARFPFNCPKPQRRRRRGRK